jgi:hypothetical protein
MVVGYCTVVVLCTVVQDYIVVSLETVVHYTVVVLQTVVWDCIVVVAQCYTVVVVQIVMLHVHPTPVCICNPFFHHLQGSTVLVFVSN